VAVFVSARMIARRTQLDVPLDSNDKVVVLQALTGG
jgi:sulfur-carrier protein